MSHAYTGWLPEKKTDGRIKCRVCLVLPRLLGRSKRSIYFVHLAFSHEATLYKYIACEQAPWEAGVGHPSLLTFYKEPFIVWTQKSFPKQQQQQPPLRKIWVSKLSDDPLNVIYLSWMEVGAIISLPYGPFVFVHKLLKLFMVADLQFVLKACAPTIFTEYYYIDSRYTVLSF
jgi:hypothetical protein